MTKILRISHEMRSRSEFIRPADEAVVALMDVDRITHPERRASGDRSNEKAMMRLSATIAAGR